MCDSSRTLPGNSYASSDSSASAATRGTGRFKRSACLREEVMHEQRDVLLALAQRRHVHRHDLQAEVEILAEASVRDVLP